MEYKDRIYGLDSNEWRKLLLLLFSIIIFTVIFLSIIFYLFFFYRTLIKIAEFRYYAKLNIYAFTTLSTIFLKK